MRVVIEMALSEIVMASSEADQHVVGATVTKDR